MDTSSACDASAGSAHSAAMKVVIRMALLAGLVVVGFATPAAAQPPGITVTPAIQQLSLSDGQQEATFTVAITNMTPAAATIAVSAEDFTYLGEDGAIQFVPPPSSGAPSSSEHSLASQIQSVTPLVRVAPGATVQVPLKITHANALAAGGHYAAVLCRLVSSGQSSAANISLVPTVATLVFVSTAGQGTQELHVSAPITSQLQVGLPSQDNVVFSNLGNTQATVRGLLEVYGLGNSMVQRGTLNVDSALVLPGAKRLFEVDMLPQNGQPLLPGRYRLTVLYRHDGQSQYDRYDEQFWLVPTWFVGAVALLILVGCVIAWRRAGRARHYRAKAPQK